MANPGFPIGGGAEPLGGTDLRRGCFAVKTYAKTKELDPVGGEARASGTPPGSANDQYLVCHNALVQGMCNFC